MRRRMLLFDNLGLQKVIRFNLFMQSLMIEA
jgi:hypothetical protein